MLPIADAVVVADQHAGWDHSRCDGLLAQAQAGFVGQAVGFARVHFAVGEDAVVPGRLAAARARDDVVDVALFRREFAAGVLADAAVALPDAADAEARATHRMPVSGINHVLADPNIIAPLALERVEVLADGASSVYGSDAVAGVVNFITRRNVEGVEATLQTGIADSYGTVNAGILGL